MQRMYFVCRQIMPQLESVSQQIIAPDSQMLCSEEEVQAVQMYIGQLHAHAMQNAQQSR